MIAACLTDEIVSKVDDGSFFAAVHPSPPAVTAIVTSGALFVEDLVLKREGGDQFFVRSFYCCRWSEALEIGGTKFAAFTFEVK